MASAPAEVSQLIADLLSLRSAEAGRTPDAELPTEFAGPVLYTFEGMCLDARVSKFDESHPAS